MAARRVDPGNGGVVLAEGGVAEAALKAIAAGDRPVEQHAVAFAHRVDVFADSDDFTRTFVAENHRFAPGKRIEIRVTDASGADAHQHLVGERLADFGGGHLEVAVAVADDGPGVHDGR